MKKPGVVYSSEDRNRISNLEKLKENAFNAAQHAHKNPNEKRYAEQQMDEYLKESAECALLGTPLYTRENGDTGSITKIYNYLYDVKWFAHAPGEQTQYGTYRGLLILFDKVRYEKDKIICKDIRDNGENERYISSEKGIRHFGAGEYELEIDQFVPLKLITPPKEIKVGDYFLASAFSRSGVQFKPIQSFSSNPWRSDEITSFVCNSSYSIKGAWGSRCGGLICMLKSDDKLKKLLSNASVWV